MTLPSRRLPVTNWGRYPVVDAQVHELPESVDQLAASLSDVPSYIARGMGRCYGDSALGDAIVSTTGRRRVHAFDAQTGLLTCDAGVTFADILEQFVPRGWFPPVTPGTKFVTLGGAIASDVHGKNHHAEGCISAHVASFLLLTPRGDTVRCSRTEHADLFWATVGGMGLTGIILSVELRLKAIVNPMIAQRAIKVENLSELLSLFSTHASTTYSVAWIDTLQQGRRIGRSILLLGEHDADARGAPQAPSPTLAPRFALTVPFDLPSFTLNRLTIGAFNWLFYHKHRQRDARTRLHYEPYFYPLDVVHHWNRIYGRRGFTQYQFAVPFVAGSAAIAAVLQACNRAGYGSFLSVLKAFGPKNSGLLSFPIEGLTLTLDLPIRDGVFALLDQLDAIVVDHGGRVYLTKDVRLGRRMFDRMYPEADAFRAVRETIDPHRRLQSLQSRRLEL